MRIYFAFGNMKVSKEVSNALSWIGDIFHASNYKLKTNILSGADAVAVIGNDEEIMNFISRLRKQPGVALLPIIGIQEKESKIIKEAVDFYSLEYTFPDKKALAKNVVEDINKRMEEFKNIDSEISEEMLILRYLITRNTKIKPIIHIDAFKGYSYPQVEPFVSGDVFSLLASMEVDNLLSGEFVDRIHLCPFCGAAHLNFREVCPKCKSANIHIEDTIHHFRCGYVGPESDFKIPGTDDLVCPKCRKELKHIGVDYDKPSQLYVCDNCGNIFEEPVTEATCLNCKQTFNSDSVALLDIKKYSLTSYGINVAKTGFLKRLKFDEIITNSFDTASVDFFKIMVNYNIALRERYNRKFTVVKMHFYGMKELQKEEGYKIALEIMKGAARMLKENLRDTDIICAINEETVLILFSETTEKIAKKVIDRIANKLFEFLPPGIVIKSEIVENYSEIKTTTENKEGE